MIKKPEYYDEYGDMTPYMWRYMKVLMAFYRATGRMHSTPSKPVELTPREKIAFHLFMLSHKTRTSIFRVIGATILRP